MIWTPTLKRVLIMLLVLVLIVDAISRFNYMRNCSFWANVLLIYMQSTREILGWLPHLSPSCLYESTCLLYFYQCTIWRFSSYPCVMSNPPCLNSEIISSGIGTRGFLVCAYDCLMVSVKPSLPNDSVGLWDLKPWCRSSVILLESTLWIDYMTKHLPHLV